MHVAVVSGENAAIGAVSGWSPLREQGLRVFDWNATVDVGEFDKLASNITQPLRLKSLSFLAQSFTHGCVRCDDDIGTSAGVATSKLNSFGHQVCLNQKGTNR